MQGSHHFKFIAYFTMQ